MAAKAHAILSASSSDRWLHCPPSARLCETYEDKGSDYAAEGTDAHALGEHKLKTALGLPSEDPTDSLKWYSEEMEDCTSGYAEYVLEQIEVAKETCADPVVLIEQRVDFSRWVEQGFGTADCVIIADGTLRVIDYKHGLGVLVSAEENPQIQFYGYRVCSSFSEAPSAGTATFTLSPRHFIDVDGNECQPDRAFKLTCEMLRRKPDSALIWYEDFRDYGVLQTNYWTTLSGSWTVWREDEYSESRVYSQLDGSGKLAWRYDGFSDIHLRARLAFPVTGSGKAGVFCGDLFCCLNYDSQAVELYNGSTLLGSYSQTIERTANADLRTDPSMYTVELRIRGNKARVYSGSSYTLRFTATVSGFSGGYAGYRSDNRTVCELLRLGDAWTYEPYERFDVTFPDGTVTQYGRISRSNATWDTEFQVFTLTSDIEEDATRSESISLDYEFYHSHELALTCGNDYTVTITPKDINIWIARLFLGDADGFSILYYQDVDSLVYWANEAAYRWGVRGFAMWSLGQEDMRLWEALPKQI